MGEGVTKPGGESSDATGRVQPPLRRAVRRAALCVVLLGYVGFGFVILYRPDPSNGMRGAESLLAWASLMGTTFLPHAGVALAVGMVVCVLVRARLAAVVGVPLLVLSAGPWLVSYTGGDDARSGGDTVLVLSANLLGTSRSDVELLAQIDAHSPDVIVLQEVRAESYARLVAALGDRYVAAAEPREHLFGVATFTRLPFSRASEVVLPLAGADLPQLVSWVDWSGRELCVWNVHLLPPVGLDEVGSQARMSWEMGSRLDEAVGSGALVVVAGDFNSPWRAQPLDVLRDRGFAEAHREAGRGPGATWPARGGLSLPPGIRIDHAAVSPGLVCVEAWVGDPTGSDHRPVFARLARE